MSGDGTTHSLGDRCPGGHYDDRTAVEAEIAALRARVANLEARLDVCRNAAIRGDETTIDTVLAATDIEA